MPTFTVSVSPITMVEQECALSPFTTTTTPISAHYLDIFIQSCRDMPFHFSFGWPKQWRWQGTWSIKSTGSAKKVLIPRTFGGKESFGSKTESMLISPSRIGKVWTLATSSCRMDTFISVMIFIQRSHGQICYNGSLLSNRNTRREGNKNNNKKKKKNSYNFYFELNCFHCISGSSSFNSGHKILWLSLLEISSMMMTCLGLFYVVPQHCQRILGILVRISQLNPLRIKVHFKRKKIKNTKREMKKYISIW